jgi:hypothetical protein
MITLYKKHIQDIIFNKTCIYKTVFKTWNYQVNLILILY